MGQLLHCIRDHTPLPSWAPVPETQAGGVPILRDDNLHPVMAEILAAHAAAPVQAQRAEYVALLKSCDWFAEFSDDYRSVKRGREQLMRIRALQPHVDPDRALFNAARPNTHGAAAL